MAKPTITKADLAMSSVLIEYYDKLDKIAGDGGAKERDTRVRDALGWEKKPDNTVRHLLARQQRPSLEEAAQIAAKFDEMQRERHALGVIMQAGLRAMENSKDAEFYSSYADAVRRYLFPNGNMAGGNGGQD